MEKELEAFLSPSFSPLAYCSSLTSSLTTASGMESCFISIVLCIIMFLLLVSIDVRDTISRLKAKQEEVDQGLAEVVSSNTDEIIHKVSESERVFEELKAFHATVAATNKTVKTSATEFQSTFSELQNIVS